MKAQFILFILILVSINSYSQTSNQVDLTDLIYNSEIVELDNQLKKGLDPNTKTKVRVAESDYWGLSVNYTNKEMPLIQAAAYYGKSEIIKLLIRNKAKIDGDQGIIVLNLLIEKSNQEMVDFLVPNYIKPGIQSLSVALASKDGNIINHITSNLREDVAENDVLAEIVKAGNSCFRDEDYSMSVGFFNMAAHFDNVEKDELYLRRGQSYYHLNHYDNALDDFNSFLALAKKSEKHEDRAAYIYLLRGICKIQTGQSKESYTADFREAEKLGFDVRAIEALNDFYP